MIKWFKKRNTVEFSNSTKYWKDRYLNNGNSGAGSYNKLAEFKADVLNDFVASNNIDKVIEFGCGNGNQLQYFNFKSYVGYDVSEAAVSLCKDVFERRSDMEFFTLPQSNYQKGDLVISLDVIYHLIEDEVFIEYMQLLFANSNRFVVIYSSNSNELEDSAPHVMHREFTKWIGENIDDFELISHIPNAYPFNPKKHRKTSFADFFVYQKVAS